MGRAAARRCTVTAMAETASTRVDWALLADYALLDVTGKLSAIGIFSQLAAVAFPSVHPVIYFVSSCAAEPNRSVASELRVWSPVKELMIAGKQQVQLGSDGRANGVFRLSPLPLPMAGQYLFELLLDGVSALHLELSVLQVALP